MIPTKHNKKKVLAEKRRKENEAALYGLSDDLLEKGYRYDDTGVYIPYPDKDNAEFYLKLSRTEGKKQEIIYSWTKKEENEFRTLSMHKSNKLILEVDSKLNKNLIGAAKIAGININEETFDDYVMGIKTTIINSHRLNVLKEIDFKFPENETEKDSTVKDEEEVEEEHPKVRPFEDYPELIKEEALKIINEGKLYEELIKSISLTHEGNDELKKQILLILASIFIDDPVHTELNADTGVGKTDIVVETIKNFPKEYIHMLRTVSPKHIYYDRESYGEFNIIVFDDIILNEDIIGVIKEFSDNKKEDKELRTVNDGKADVYTMPGKYLVILTYAKNNPDEELLNRLYKLNIVIKEKNKKTDIKNAIKDNAIINVNNNKIISRTRYIMQAAIQYLVEQNIKIFNPFLIQFDPTTFSNRNIGSFISLVKSQSFYHTNNLKYVELLDQKIYIGSYEDFENVAMLWADSKDIQKYKLNAKQIKILEYLPELTPIEAYTQNKKDFDEYKAAPTRKEKDEIEDRLYSRTNIAKAVGINKDSVRNYLDYSKSTAKSLFDFGLIGRIQFDKDNEKSPYTYYKIKRDDRPEETLWYNCQIKNDNQFNDLNYKIKIILSLLLLANITINKEGYQYIKNYCETYTHPLEPENYDSYYNFITWALVGFDFDNHAIDINEATHADLNFVAEKWASLKKSSEKNDKIPQPFLKNFDRPDEKDSNESFEETGKKTNVISKMTKEHNGIDNTKIFGSNINRPDYALKVCNLLIDRNLTGKELYDKIYANVDMNGPDSEFYCSIEFKEELHYLEMGNYISCYSNKNGETCYQLSDYLKKLLSGTDFATRNDVEIFEMDILMADYGFKLFDL